LETELEKKRTLIFREELKFRQQTEAQLANLEKMQSKIVDDILERTKSKRQQQEEKIATLVETIQKGLSHLDLDSKILEDKEKKIHESILQLTKPFEEEKKEWTAKRDLVQVHKHFIFLRVNEKLSIIVFCDL
jgi:hypothetical protein